MPKSEAVARWRLRQLLLGSVIAACPLALNGDQSPRDQPTFNFDGEQLEQEWDVLQRDTVQQYPSLEWVATQLAHPGLCAATLATLMEKDEVSAASITPTSTPSSTPEPVLDSDSDSNLDLGSDSEPAPDCSAVDVQYIATTLQQAWRDYFTGAYQRAITAGEGLGLIGYPVAGYARIAYAQQMPASSAEKKITVLEQAITNADAYEKVASGSAYSLLISAYAMSRIMEDLSMSAALVTGYNSEARTRLEMLIQAYPKHAKGAATYGGYNGGIIGKSGQFVARISYSASPEKMESGFATAMKVEPPLIGSYVEYAIALERVYGKKQREKARQTLEKAVTFTPLDAGGAWALAHARTLLATFDEE